MPYAVLAIALASAQQTRLLSPGEVEMRLVGGTNVVLTNVNFGAIAEVGLGRIGPGTLAIGPEVDVGICASICSLVGLLTGLRYEQSFWLPSLRLEYHFAIPPNPTLRNVDLYGALLLGAGYARVEARDGQGALVYRGTAAAPTGALALGLSWFWGPVLFGGFELRGRYAQADFRMTERDDGYEFQNELEPRWFASGFNWMAYVGARW